jgi:hypothetical protein
MTPGIDYSKPFLLACAFTLLGGFASAQIPTEGMFGVSIREQFYPVLGTGADTSLAVGMTISSYPDDTTLSVVREKLSGLAEVDRLKVPEYLLLRTWLPKARKKRSSISIMAMRARISLETNVGAIWNIQRRSPEIKWTIICLKQKRILALLFASGISRSLKMAFQSAAQS